VVRQFHPQRVILFGSRAYGKPSATSDVDLLVIMAFDCSPYRMTARPLGAIGPTWRGGGFDIKARRPEDVDWRYREGDPMIRDAIDRGIVLYEAAA
jgi:hypothetical protein